MAEQTIQGTRPAGAFGRGLYALARLLAVFGGFLCCAMAVLVTVSVTGRYLIDSPVPGDYDIVAIMSGSAVFAFLPWCQMTRGNVVVDFFTTNVGARGQAALNALGGALYLVVGGLFTWRLYYGAVELRATSEVLAVVNFYRWWTLPFDIFCMAVLIAAIAWTLARDIGEARPDR